MRGFLSGISVLAVVFFCCAVSVSAQDIRRQEEAKARLEKEIAILDQQLAANADRSKDALTQLSLIQKKISNRKALIRQSDRQIRIYSDEIYSTQRQINRLQAREDTLTYYYARLVRSAYKNRDAKIWYMYIIASENLGQAFRRFSYFKGLSAQMKEQAKEIRAVQAELEAERSRLQDLKKEAEAIRQQRKTELASLQSEEAQSAKVVTQLRKNRTRYQKELNAKKRQVEALDKELIEKLEVKEMFAIVLRMLGDLQQALRDEDPVKATSVLSQDDQLDRINKASAGILAGYAAAHTDAIPFCLGFGGVFRKLERTGDHLTNIAEEIVFYIDAKVLKHNDSQQEDPARQA